jgi:hypothetical protein
MIIHKHYLKDHKSMSNQSQDKQKRSNPGLGRPVKVAEGRWREAEYDEPPPKLPAGFTLAQTSDGFIMTRRWRQPDDWMLIAVVGAALFGFLFFAAEVLTSPDILIMILTYMLPMLAFSYYVASKFFNRTEVIADTNADTLKIHNGPLPVPWSISRRTIALAEVQRLTAEVSIGAVNRQVLYYIRLHRIDQTHERLMDGFKYDDADQVIAVFEQRLQIRQRHKAALRAQREAADDDPLDTIAEQAKRKQER